MQPQWKTYHHRMQNLERDLEGHNSRFHEVDSRESKHSAKLRTLEREIESLRFDNSRLYNEVVSLRGQPQEAESQPYYQQQHQQQRHEPPPRDDRVPPGHSRDDRENRATVRDDPQARRDINKIEMHEGNFKPYASNYYEDKLRGNNKVGLQGFFSTTLQLRTTGLGSSC